MAQRGGLQAKEEKSNFVPALSNFCPSRVPPRSYLALSLELFSVAGAQPSSVPPGTVRPPSRRPSIPSSLPSAAIQA